MSENETTVAAYDLEPPSPAPLVPPVLPLLDRGDRSPMPRYVPRPLAEGMVRVVLDSAGPDGEPADFMLYDEYPALVRPYRVFDVPAGQYERWRSAKEAFAAMQAEIEAAVSDRARNPPPSPSPGLPF